MVLDISEESYENGEAPGNAVSISIACLVKRII